MGFHNRTISLIPDIAAAMDRRAKRFINRNINFAPTAHPRLTTVGRQVIAVEITAPTDVDLQLARCTTDICFPAARYSHNHFSHFKFPLDPATPR